MPSNRGNTSLKSKTRRPNPMRDYDQLPLELRRWVAQAKLPWSAKSVQRSYNRAVAKTGDPKLALAELDRLQQTLVMKDASRVWAGQYLQSVNL